MPKKFGENQLLLRHGLRNLLPAANLNYMYMGRFSWKTKPCCNNWIKKNHRDILKKIVFNIKLDPTPGDNRVFRKYHENFTHKNTYKKVTILTRTGEVFEITDIPLE